MLTLTALPLIVALYAARKWEENCYDYEKQRHSVDIILYVNRFYGVNMVFEWSVFSHWCVCGYLGK